MPVSPFFKNQKLTFREVERLAKSQQMIRMELHPIAFWLSFYYAIILPLN
jgi:hypothetical protein